MEYETLVTMIRNELENSVSESKMICLHNKYCDKHSYYEDYIHDMYDLNYECEGMNALEIIDNYGNVDVNKKYYQMGIYNAHDFDWYCDAHTTFYDEIAKEIADNEYSDIPFLQDIIDTYLEEKEEENEQDNTI